MFKFLRKNKKAINLNIMGEKIEVDSDKLVKWNEKLKTTKLDKLENGELPFGWYSQNKEWTDAFDIKEKKLVDYALTSRTAKGQEKIDILREMIEYYYSLKKECYSKGECHKKYFQDGWEHCHNSRNEDFEYIEPYENELKEIENNLDEYLKRCEREKQKELKCKELEPTVKKDLLEIIKNNQGILQKEIYKNFDSDVKELIQSSLYFMSKDNMITRIKHGNTYELYTNTK